MKVSVDTQMPGEARAELLAVLLLQHDPAKWRLPARLRDLDRALGSPIAAALDSGDFRGRAGQSVLLYPGARAAVRRVLLLGLGEESKLDADALRSAAGRAVHRAAEKRARSVVLVVPGLRRLGAPQCSQALAEGGVLGGFRFDTYQKKKEDGPAPVRTLKLLFERLSDRPAARASAARGVILAESQNLARRLSNEPANVLPPAALARAAQKMAREVGLRSRVFDPAELKRRKMGALLAVGQGSSNSPRLIVLEHNAPSRSGTGDKKKSKPRGRTRATICLVGKGITFDSGGISIKPAAGMQDMKHDMSGAAAVVGALRAAALLRIPLHVVGVIPAAENMPSGTAYRPGDVVRAMSGKTIEVVNTDAEGRVVLADALHYAKTEFDPQAVIDLATLTGACMVALGPWASGVFGNDENLIERIRRAGDVTGERAWPMPLLPAHREDMRSQVADLRNAAGRHGGASTAAGFLWAFVDDTPWVHLDIAGTGWCDKASAYQPRGATGVGVRLLLELLRGWEEGRAV
ncbi:MAG: leucyl aminopeptidase [Myxococcota bacterium]